MGFRYFPATLMAGKLYRDTMVYWTEAQVDMIFNPHVGERKIHSPEELDEALRISKVRPLPTLRVWNLEGWRAKRRSSVRHRCADSPTELGRRNPPRGRTPGPLSSSQLT